MAGSGDIKTCWQEYDITVPRTVPPSYTALVTSDNCISHWPFESAAPYEDIKGTNDWDGILSSALADITQYKQGISSIEILDQFGDDPFILGLADADLSESFPLKSGYSNPALTLCFWFKPTRLLGSGSILSIYKGYGAADKSFKLDFSVSSGNVSASLYLSSNNTTWSPWNVGSKRIGTGMNTSTWYHICISIAADGSWRSRIWDDTAKAILADDVIGALGAVLATSTSTWDIFAWTGFSKPAVHSANFDDMFIFDRVLTVDEMDLIRAEHASS